MVSKGRAVNHVGDISDGMAETDSLLQVRQAEKEFSKSVQRKVLLPGTRSVPWDYVLPLIFTMLSFFTHFWRIGQSNIVTWDEAHFGKFGHYYIKREFYFDVHPPLGKMLVGLSGYLAGSNGSFSFNSGETYPPELNYVFMRIFNAAFGVACVPIAWYTAKSMRLSRSACSLVTLMVLFDNSITTISRFILLDSMLLFFTASSMLSLATVHYYRDRSFCAIWWFWLAMTGLSLGCVISVKWVGLFSVLLVGLYTIEDLWIKFGDLSMPKKVYAFHWLARIPTLIVLPILVYMLNFYIHFKVLSNSGPGDAQMPSLFQANLNGSDLNQSPLEIALGSQITIKNAGYGGGLLHSHVQTYPEGSGQQQVTTYHYKDTNNDWLILPPWGFNFDLESENFTWIGDSGVVRFFHVQTGRNLHSHEVAAPVTKSNLEVTCYGNATLGDEKDHWVFEVVKDNYGDRSRIRTLMTTFRIRHAVLGCHLQAANVNLPQWGFRQIEVTCAHNTDAKDSGTHWNVERHHNDKMPAADVKAYKSSFLTDFIHLNVAMKTSNDALIPDPDKQDDLSSKAWQWPIAHVGLRMCNWGADTVKYFLLANPFVIWSTSAGIVLMALTSVIMLLRWQRHYVDFNAAELDFLHFSGLYPFLGYCLHFVPFHIFGRVLYVHHYIPALYFAILVFGSFVDITTSRVSRPARKLIFITLYVLTVGVFIYYKDITFGMVGPSSKWKHLDWLPSWRIADIDDPAQTQPSTTPELPVGAVLENPLAAEAVEEHADGVHGTSAEANFEAPTEDVQGEAVEDISDARVEGIPEASTEDIPKAVIENIPEPLAEPAAATINV